MVHPYLRRRQGLEAVTYPTTSRQKRAGAHPGRADLPGAGDPPGHGRRGLHRRRGGPAAPRHHQLGPQQQAAHLRAEAHRGHARRGYSEDYARRLFDQIKGFGGYGFPESHSASFALLAYVSRLAQAPPPGAFYVGLLNSQPMGFYTPAQLDPGRAPPRCDVLPIDVNHSDWDHQLLDDGRAGARAPVRLGCAWSRGWPATRPSASARRAQQAPFRQIADLRRRAALDRKAMEALVDADALASLSGNRHQARWQVMALEPERPLLPTSTTRRSRNSATR
jgi:error-prone DNA polymerase